MELLSIDYSTVSQEQKRLREKIQKDKKKKNYGPLRKQFVNDKNMIPFMTALFYSPNSSRTVSPGFLSICFIFLFVGISHGEVIKKNGKFDIPYGSLLGSRKEEYRQLVETHSIFRSLQGIEFNIDRSIVNFMLDHPTFLAVTLKVMKIRNYTIEKNIGGGYFVDDLKGVSGNLEVIYSRPGQKYFYGVGGYKGVLIRVAGRGLILFEYLGGTGYPSRTIIRAHSKITLHSFKERYQ